ncbi:MAG: PKD domain protein [Methanosaeta sp. PtaU1.Bin112]|nr:MAG: PKD domain protein [Methanosaeta sp. PtaU1.Bin112]
MTAIRPLILAVVIAVISFTASAKEVAYAYGDFGSRPLVSGNITEYNGKDMVTSVVASAGANSKPPKQMSTKTVDEMKEEINIKLNVDNPAVEDKGSSLILDYPGDGTINQICSIYEYMVGNWSYKRDQRGIEVLQYSNKSLEKGEGRYSGQGDCDDFAILLASLIESIGGTSRIILAYGPYGGHAYTEVYLGAFSGSECDVERMLRWLKKKYNVQEINYHTDLDTGDVWLNLDWWRDPNTGAELAKHPGGPLFRSTNNTPISIKEGYPKVPLTPLNDPPAAQFSVSLDVPAERENITFNASKSKDIGGKIVAYKWDFGDGNRTDSLSTPEILHSYARGGFYTVSLTVQDNEDTASTSSRNITINSLPQANFTITPQIPVVGSQVRFDASGSWDEEDGKNLAYHWEINNNSAIFNLVSPPKQVYDEAGMYWVNLTVSDTNGAVGHKNYLLKINQPPIARIGIDSANLSLGRLVNFTAALSEDKDGEIVDYTWDFGDNSSVDNNKTAMHGYAEGGNKIIRLSVGDNDGARSIISQEIFINRPPIASFSIVPAEPNKGEQVSFNASSSSDPDGKLERYLWDFGIGKAMPEVYTKSLAEHTYSVAGRYDVILIVQDDKGANSSMIKSVEVGTGDCSGDYHWKNGNCVPDTSTIIYRTDFEKYSVGTLPPGFVIKYNGKGDQYQAITSDAAHSGTKSLQAWGAPNWGANIDYYFNMPESGRIGFDVYLRANSKDEGSAQFFNPEGATWGWGWAGIGFDENGNISIPASSTSNSYKMLQPPGDQWYQVRSEMDVATGATWIWVNDILFVDGKTPSEMGYVNPEAYKGIRAITFNDASWYEHPSTPIYIDDFKLYTVKS